MTEPFDGEAIARADKAFLDSLSDHPLTRRPLYGAPCPPQPDFGPFDPTDKSQDGGAASVLRQHRRLDAGELRLSRGRLHEQGRRHLARRRRNHLPSRTCAGAWRHGRCSISARAAAIKTRSPVEDWMIARSPPLDSPRGDASRPAAADLHRKRLRHLQPLPAAGASGGQAATSSRSRPSSPGSCPMTTERAWLWHWLAHKARRPWIPMVAVIMVAEEFG